LSCDQFVSLRAAGDCARRAAAVLEGSNLLLGKENLFAPGMPKNRELQR